MRKKSPRAASSVDSVNNFYETTDKYLWEEVKKTVCPLAQGKARPKALWQKKHKPIDEGGVSPKGPKVTKEDRALFEQMVDNFGMLLSSPKQAKNTHETAPSIDTQLAEPSLNTESGRKSSNSAVQPFFEKTIYKKFVKNRISISAKIDLHNLTEDEAYKVLLNFLQKCHKKGYRYVLVITGKGRSRGSYAVLKKSLPGWLGTPYFQTLVSAFEQAAAQHGGEGAFYIRIKR